jgi:PKD repeat protein
VGFQSEAWSFGDGTTANGCCPTHRYAADGDYTVKLTVTTFDGRTASASQVVHVRTHDVAITRFAVPVTANVGQTRMITVGISDSHYPETVQVQLYKSVPGPYNNFQLVGTLTQSITVLPGGRTTTFSFNYTFTADDAVAGKVTFEAVATIIGARDAQPADNTAISPPTKVNP